MANRLADALSPYLRQHQDNPVHWQQWGDDAFAEAQRRDVPILLSVGYAACHWCHVMAHESFDDPEIAAYLNPRFVAVKVDREERPDVDAVYMEALQTMTGQGGWPMTVFLTPTGRPFYAGTYYPPRPMAQMPSFRQVLEAIDAAWGDRRAEVLGSADSIAEHLGAAGTLPQGSAPSASVLDAAVDLLERDHDPTNGGFGSAPKFPPSMVLEFLLRHAAHTGDSRGREMVALTCERMARGGMYDQLGGGFSRYSVDASWVVPHFEKMLYDNALLLRAYLHWWRSSGSPLALRVVEETVAFLLRDLRTPEGGFASALDADALGPDGVSAEGASYVWTPQQLIEVLGPDDGSRAAALLHVTPTGTFEHATSTLQLPADPSDDLPWPTWRSALLAARNERPQPARDDKVVTAWNGLTIAALAEAGALLDRPDWIEAAQRCAQLLVDVHHAGTGDLRRVSRDGDTGQHPGILEDYAAAAEGFLALLSATGEPRWLEHAQACAEQILTRFRAPDGGFFDTADDAQDPRLSEVKRPRDPGDNVTPSGTSAAAGVLVTLTAVTGDARYREAAEAALGVYGPLAERVPRFAGWALAVAQAVQAGPVEVAVVGSADDARTAELLRVARASGAPGAVVVPGIAADAAERIPLLAGRDLVDQRPTAYVCRGFVCQAPTTDPADLVAQLLS